MAVFILMALCAISQDKSKKKVEQFTHSQKACRESALLWHILLEQGICGVEIIWQNSAELPPQMAQFDKLCQNLVVRNTAPLSL